MSMSLSSLLKVAQLQKWLDEQEEEVAREFKKSALERDVATRVQNQLLTQVEILRRAQTRGSD